MHVGERRAPRPVVLSMGGSVLRTGSEDAKFLQELGAILHRVGTERPLLVTTGGGRTAREYIDLGRTLGLTEVELDELGLEVTRLHARLLAAVVGPPAPTEPPISLAQAVREAHRTSPVILGGTEPGHTTDAVAGMLAVRVRASHVVNATSVDGVYDRDPKRGEGARRLDRMAWPEFSEFVRREVGQGRAGQEFLFDALGAEVLARANIPLFVVHGRELANLERALTSMTFTGSRIGDT